MDKQVKQESCVEQLWQWQCQDIKSTMASEKDLKLIFHSNSFNTVALQQKSALTYVVARRQLAVRPFGATIQDF
jgi:hypothetical protein